MKRQLKHINKLLTVVEKWGNTLPHPATLFMFFSIIVLIFSYITYHFGWSATNPITKEVVLPVNLLSRQGIHTILKDLVINFTSFTPLGVVIVAMLGIGIAEDSGLINATIRLVIASTQKKRITFVIIFTGVMSNIASDAGHILIIPLAGVIFRSIGRHPIVGMAAAFAGVSGGYSANMLLGTLDPLLAGLSTEAAHIVNPNYDVNPTANYYFLAVSAIILSFTGTWITEKIVEPHFKEYKTDDNKKITLERLSEIELKGIKRVAVLSVITIVILLVTVIPENGFFRGMDGTLLNSPFIKGVIALLFIFSSTMGIIYGFTTKKYTSDSDVVSGMSEAIKTLGAYIVLVFFAAQFVAFFKMSNLGIILAIKGASAIQNTGLEIIPLTLLFILFSALINLLMGSASAKWAIMAPIFIPMFMIVGYSPEYTQAVYRIGDSATNIISPMLSFFPLIITFIQKYDKKAGIGTIVSTMLPYSIAFIFVWSLLMILWIITGLPIGPGAEIYYPT